MASKRETVESVSPVRILAGEEDRVPEDGMGLCLSGGGYRAMLFHAGAVWRLGETGLLQKLRRVSSVSGGSITAGVLGMRWKELGFDGDGVPRNLGGAVVDPIRRLASRTVDVPAIATGTAWFGSIADHVVGRLKKHLFGDATLQGLPSDAEGPRFVINATNVQTGALWRFSRPYMADYRVGRVDSPTVPLAVAVAASAAFPPFLSPLELELEPDQVADSSGADLHLEPFTSQVVLTDGGVYDNLGLETVWKRYRTVLVSDGGGDTGAEGDPKRDWPRHTYRVLNLIDDQVRALRKQQVVDSFCAPAGDRNHRAGAYWGIRVDIAKYKLDDALPAPHVKTMELANTATRLKALPDELQKRIINWGYAAADAGIRAHVTRAVPAPAWPYPDATP